MECRFALYMDYGIAAGIIVCQCFLLCFLGLFTYARGKIKKKNRQIRQMNSVQMVDIVKQSKVVSEEAKGEKEKPKCENCSCVIVLAFDHLNFRNKSSDVAWDEIFDQEAPDDQETRWVSVIECPVSVIGVPDHQDSQLQEQKQRGGLGRDYHPRRSRRQRVGVRSV